jgi:hypothetical protein
VFAIGLSLNALPQLRRDEPAQPLGIPGEPMKGAVVSDSTMVKTPEVHENENREERPGQVSGQNLYLPGNTDTFSIPIINRENYAEVVYLWECVWAVLECFWPYYVGCGLISCI